MAPTPMGYRRLAIGTGTAVAVVALCGTAIAGDGTGEGWQTHPGGRIAATTWGEFSVVGPDDAWVAGSFTPGDDFGSKVAHWDGERWSEVEDAPYDTHAIEAISADDVWAMSGYSDRADVIQHWNGERWKPVDVPAKPGSDDPYLRTTFEDSYASAPDDIWAVGSVETDTTGDRTETVHWNGERWQWVPAPTYDAPRSMFTAVSGTAADDVWAAGYTDDTTTQAITAHWNGEVWEKVALPDLPKNARIDDITARSPEAVWAVGEVGYKPLALFYDGSEWRLVSSTPTDPGDLTAIAPDGKGGLWAVGNQYPDDQPAWPTPYFLHWNGESWDRTEAPGGAGGMYGIANVPGTEAMWAGGTQAGQSEDIPENGLIDRYGTLPD